MGGGGFTMQERTSALDRLVLTMTGEPVPKVCFLPTASGDPREQTTRFYERFGSWPCEPSILSLFHLGRDRIDPIKHLLAQDAIYVGGGSIRNMLAVWREHDSGLSAGAMCRFAGGITMSGGAPEPVVGLGLLPGSLSVHLDGEPERRRVYRAAVAAGELLSGYALDDSAALVFHGTRLSACVASRAGARVLRVQADGAGEASERELAVHVLPGVGTTEAGLDESHGVSELRALRAGRRRWD